MGWVDSSHRDRIRLHNTALQSFLEATFVLDHNALALVCSPAILHRCPQGNKRMEAHLMGYHQSCRIRCARHGAVAYGLPAHEYRPAQHDLDTVGWRRASQMDFHPGGVLINTSM